MADNTYFFVKEEGGAKKRKMEVEDELERRRRWEMVIRKESERAKMQALVPMDARFNEDFQLYYRTQLATLSSAEGRRRSAKGCTIVIHEK